MLRGADLVLLAGGRGQRLLPLGGRRYRLAGTTTDVEFTAGPTLRLDGWRPRVYRQAAAARPSAQRLAEYAGTYHSAELDVAYRLRAEGRRLTLRHRKLGSIRLTPTFDDGFYGGGWYFTFDRGSGGELRGFTMSSPRARNVRFRLRPAAPALPERVEPWPGACGEPAPPPPCTSDRS